MVTSRGGLTLVGVLRAGYSPRSLAIAERIDTVWRDWHRLEDGNHGFWGTRCRQVVSIPLNGVNAAERCRYLGQGLGTRPWPGLARGFAHEAVVRTGAAAARRRAWP